MFKYIKQLSCRDPTLKHIYLFNNKHTDTQLSKLTDCLLAHPDVVKRVLLGGNQLTVKTGVKLARYLAASSTNEWLDLRSNQFGSDTYLAVAAALRVNSSLRVLHLYGNPAVDQTCTDAAFAEALRLNPVRPIVSSWELYSVSSYPNQLNRVAKKSMPPSMLEFLLYVHLNY